MRTCLLHVGRGHKRSGVDNRKIRIELRKTIDHGLLRALDVRYYMGIVLF